MVAREFKGRKLFLKQRMIINVQRAGLMVDDLGLCQCDSAIPNAAQGYLPGMRLLKQFAKWWMGLKRAAQASTNDQQVDS